MLGDLPPSAAGNRVARRHAACSSSARAERSREGGDKGAMLGLPDAAAPRYQTSAGVRDGAAGLCKASDGVFSLCV